ncbi:hypothetical protein RSOLAG1IB_06136 [Rhizoctonia solani AG-1 IB]|uniref:Uncharacterized protein n=1 Tax=Thanatephorus cucumeris (strain AG1-IB / isolate 7/3/14) TaxID=1108050 RepID=A0A0B7FA69_THACB|nr:hypothetical protein RSOLAG1IB_06136 [Rhizoctonia solani AG-1 IB]
MEGDEPIWSETEHGGLRSRDNSITAHFSPGCQAGTWPKPSSCGMYTRAFFNIPPNEKLSLREILKRLKSDVGQMRNSHDPGNEGELWRQYKVYCSRKIDDPHFFQALGFNLSTQDGAGPHEAQTKYTSKTEDQLPSIILSIILFFCYSFISFFYSSFWINQWVPQLVVAQYSSCFMVAGLFTYVVVFI